MYFKRLSVHSALIEIMTIFDIGQKSKRFLFDLFAHDISSIFHEDMRYKNPMERGFPFLYKGHSLYSLVFGNYVMFGFSVTDISTMRCLKFCVGKNNILSDLVVFGYLLEQRKCFIFFFLF